MNYEKQAPLRYGLKDPTLYYTQSISHTSMAANPPIKRVAVCFAASRSGGVLEQSRGKGRVESKSARCWRGTHINLATPASFVDVAIYSHSWLDTVIRPLGVAMDAQNWLLEESVFSRRSLQRGISLSELWERDVPQSIRLNDWRGESLYISYTVCSFQYSKIR